MAPKLSLRALPMRTALAPLARLPITALRGCHAPFSDKAGGGGDAPRLSASTEAWIARLKETHGERWQAVYDESRARQARNEELIREKHRQNSDKKKKKQQQQKDDGAGAGAGAGEGRVEQAEEAWIAQLKARHGEDGWRAAYEQRKAAFEEGAAKTKRAADALREKSRAEKKARQAEERRARLEAQMRGEGETTA